MSGFFSIKFLPNVSSWTLVGLRYLVNKTWGDLCSVCRKKASQTRSWIELEKWEANIMHEKSSDVIVWYSPKKIPDHSSIVGGANNGWLQPASFCVESSRLKSAVIAKCSSEATKSAAAAALVFLHFFNSNHFKLFAFPLLMKFSNANATTKYIVLCRMEGSSIFKQRIFTEFYWQCLACSNDLITFWSLFHCSSNFAEKLAAEMYERLCHQNFKI